MSDRDAFRAEQQERRSHGLKARHETREARAVRKQVAEDIKSEAAITSALDEFERHGRMWSGRDSAVWHCKCGAEIQGMGEPGSATLARRHVLAEIVQVLSREIGSRDPA